MHLQREYAGAPRGQIIEDVKRGKKVERVNVIGALCDEEYYSIECYKQTTNSEFFEAWFENRMLKEIPKECTVSHFHQHTHVYFWVLFLLLLYTLPALLPIFHNS